MSTISRTGIGGSGTFTASIASVSGLATFLARSWGTRASVRWAANGLFSAGKPNGAILPSTRFWSALSAEHARALAPTELAELAQRQLVRRDAFGSGAQGVFDLWLAIGRRLAEELQCDVDVLRPHPAQALEAHPPHLGGEIGEALPHACRQFDRNEQAEDAWLVAHDGDPVETRPRSASALP